MTLLGLIGAAGVLSVLAPCMGAWAEDHARPDVDAVAFAVFVCSFTVMVGGILGMLARWAIGAVS